MAIDATVKAPQISSVFWRGDIRPHSLSLESRDQEVFMSTMRNLLFVFAMTATATLSWAGGEPVVSPDDALPEAPSVFIWVSVPPEAAVTESLTVRVVITNRRQYEPYVLEDIDISDRYLDGFELDTSKPQPYEVDHGVGTLTLTYGLHVAGQQSEEILIKLRATKVGVFSGDIDLWSNDTDECATRRLQTEIVAEPER